VGVTESGLSCSVYENWAFIEELNEKPNPLSVFIQGFVESLVFINGFMKTQIHFCFTQGRRAL
jgi:hypothetical protein